MTMALPTIVNNTSVGKAFDKGLKLYKENFTMVFVTSLLAALVGGLTCGICMPVMTCGLYAVLLALLRRVEPKPTIGDVFSKFPHFLTAFVSAIVITLLTGLISTVLLVVPVIGMLASYVVSTIIAPAVMSWAYLAIIDRNATISEAISSLKLPMEKPFWLFVLVSFVASLIGCVGALACGIGLLFTIPLAYCIVIAAYNDMVGGANDAIDVDASSISKPPTDAR